MNRPELIERISKRVGEAKFPITLVLFGSYAAGNFTTESDIEFATLLKNGPSIINFIKLISGLAKFNPLDFYNNKDAEDLKRNNIDFIRLKVLIKDVPVGFHIIIKKRLNKSKKITKVRLINTYFGLEFNLNDKKGPIKKVGNKGVRVEYTPTLKGELWRFERKFQRVDPHRTDCTSWGDIKLEGDRVLCFSKRKLFSGKILFSNSEQQVEFIDRLRIKVLRQISDLTCPKSSRELFENVMKFLIVPKHGTDPFSIYNEEYQSEILSLCSRISLREIEIYPQNTPLSGKVNIQGSKNSVSKLLGATLLTNSKSCLLNIPIIKDLEILCNFLSWSGHQTRLDSKRKRLEIVTYGHGQEVIIGKNFANSSRALLLLLPGLLLNHRKITFYDFKGCAIGKRPISWYLNILEKFGVKILSQHNHTVLKLKQNSFKANDIKLPAPSVSGTSVALLCACLTNGKSKITNASNEPEVMTLVEMLNKMGAKIKFVSDREFHATGVASLRGVKFAVPPDRNVFFTYLIAVLITRGSVKFLNYSASQIIRDKSLKRFLETQE